MREPGHASQVRMRDLPAGTGGRHVAYVIDSLQTGGTERHLVRLVRGLVDCGWHVSVYCLAPGGKLVPELEELGVRVEGPPLGWSKSARSVTLATAHLADYLRHERPAIVHCYLPTAGLIGAMAGRIAAVPVVVTTRRSVHNRSGVRLIVYRLTTAVADRLSNAVIAVCEAAREQAIREGTPGGRITTIYNGVPESQRRGIRHNLFTGSPVIGTIGRLHASKGYASLIEAMPLVREKLPQARLVLVGEGREREQLENRVRELRLNSHVDFVGERSDAAGLLPEFDIFVLPSVIEGMPNAVLEAAMAGIPVVATRVGGVPEVIQDSISGLLVEPGSSVSLAHALVRMGQDDSLRGECGKNAYDRVIRQFGVGEEIRRTESVYLSLLAAKGMDIHNGGTQQGAARA